MKDEKEFTEFLGYLQFPEGKEKELKDYIVTIMSKAEKDGKPMEFDFLAKGSSMPNPCVGHDGRLVLDTAKLRLVFEDWKANVRYVKSEAANLALERFLIIHDIAASPLKN